MGQGTTSGGCHGLRRGCGGGGRDKRLARTKSCQRLWIGRLLMNVLVAAVVASAAAIRTTKIGIITTSRHRGHSLYIYIIIYIFKLIQSNIYISKYNSL